MQKHNVLQSLCCQFEQSITKHEIEARIRIAKHTMDPQLRGFMLLVIPMHRYDIKMYAQWIFEHYDWLYFCK